MPTDQWPRLESPAKGWFVSTMMPLTVQQDEQGRMCLGPDTKMPLQLWLIDLILAAVGLGIVAIPFWLRALSPLWSCLTVAIGIVGIVGIFLPQLWVRWRERQAGSILRKGPGDLGYEFPRLYEVVEADRVHQLAEVEGWFFVARSTGSGPRYRAFQVFAVVDGPDGVQQLLLNTSAQPMPEHVRQRIHSEFGLAIDVLSVGQKDAVRITGAIRLF